MIPPEQMPYAVGLPYRDGAPMVYDGGDYPAALVRAIAELGGLEAFRARQDAAREDGRYLGLGLGCYTEGTGVGPFEGATVKIDPSGKVIVATGACPQGQGHETVFAQVTADIWRVPIEDVVVQLADTGSLTMGYGTLASRSTVASSMAIEQASDKLKERVFAVAAHLLETGEADLELRAGTVGVKGVPDRALSLREIAAAAAPGTGEFPGPPRAAWTRSTTRVDRRCMTTSRSSTLRSRWRWRMRAGIATAKPAAVVTRASDMPDASTLGLPMPSSTSTRNTSIIPRTVPSSPSSGLIAAMVPRAVR